MPFSLLPTATSLSGSKNISVAVEGSKLYMYCDLSRSFGASTSGKTFVVASSSGNKPLGVTNAFLGMNLFCKSEENRKLDEEATLELREMTTMGSHCQWCVDGQTLCVMIDFNAVGEKVASSGKSVLLASSGGNKAIGKTGIMCGMNCYVPLGKTFLMDKISTVASNAVISVDDRVDLGEGFVLRMESDTQVVVCCGYNTKGDAGTKSMSPLNFNGKATIAFSLKRSSKKRKVEEGTEQKNGDFFVPSSKAKNVLVRCVASDAGDGVVDIEVRFDPTQSFGRSASGKSVTIASSGGWCDVDNDISINFNVYKPSPPLTYAEIEGAVREVLGGRTREEIVALSFKTVLAEVASVLGAKEGEGVGEAKEWVREAVTAHVGGLTFSIPSDEIKKAVDSVLVSHSKEEAAALSFKSVLAEVASVLGVKEGEGVEEIKEQVKEAVKHHFWSRTE